MSEKAQTLDEFIRFVSRAANAAGPGAALNHFENISSLENTPEFLKGLNSAFKLSADHEKAKNLLLLRALNLSGHFLPLSVFFNSGFPQKEFLIYTQFLSGRIGDILLKLAKLIHAMHHLDLVLCVDSRLSLFNNILLSSKDSFHSNLPAIELYSDLYRYLEESIEHKPFSRGYLINSSRQLFSKLPDKSEYNKFNLDRNIIVHVRGGDALFEGAIELPPLSYYTKSIDELTPEKVIILYEPDQLNKYPGSNPVPNKLKAYCQASNIESILVSSEDVFYDAGILFWAKKIIASTSSFSQILSMFNDQCDYLRIPEKLDNQSQWLDDKSIQYVDCWLGFDDTKWHKDMNYRLAWVCGEI